jgi:hypothetical protein
VCAAPILVHHFHALAGKRRDAGFAAFHAEKVAELLGDSLCFIGILGIDAHVGEAQTERLVFGWCHGRLLSSMSFDDSAPTTYNRVIEREYGS